MAVHVSTFKNIDVSQQGIYQVRFSIYHLSADSSKASSSPDNSP